MEAVLSLIVTPVIRAPDCKTLPNPAQVHVCADDQAIEVTLGSSGASLVIKPVQLTDGVVWSVDLRRNGKPRLEAYANETGIKAHESDSQKCVFADVKE